MKEQTPQAGLFFWLAMLIIGVPVLIGICNTSTVRTDEQSRTAAPWMPGRDAPTYLIITGSTQQAYKSIEIEELQKLIGVDDDGKVGPVTYKKVMELNRLDEIK